MRKNNNTVSSDIEHKYGYYSTIIIKYMTKKVIKEKEKIFQVVVDVSWEVVCRFPHKLKHSDIYWSTMLWC